MPEYSGLKSFVQCFLFVCLYFFFKVDLEAKSKEDREREDVNERRGKFQE